MGVSNRVWEFILPINPLAEADNVIGHALATCRRVLAQLLVTIPMILLVRCISITGSFQIVTRL